MNLARQFDFDMQGGTQDRNPLEDHLRKPLQAHPGEHVTGHLACLERHEIR